MTKKAAVDAGVVRKGSARMVGVLDVAREHVAFWTCSHCSWTYAPSKYPAERDGDAAALAVEGFLDHRCAGSDAQPSGFPFCLAPPPTA